MFELARDPRVAPRLNFDGVVAATSDFDPAWRSINVASGAERSDAILRSGLDKLADNRQHTVESALEKLADNRHQDITPSEMFGLEAIVFRQSRPVVFVRDNSYDDVGARWSDLNLPEVKTRLSALFPLIGRIELPTSPILPYPGTGFVVGKGLVATSRAVAQNLLTRPRPDRSIPRGRRGDQLQTTGRHSRRRPLRLLRRERRGDDPSILGHGPTAGGRIAGRQDASLVGAPRRSSSSIAISWWSATRRSILETTRHSRIRS
jgi:hypothetical protein